MWRSYRRDPGRVPAKVESEQTGKRGRPRKVYVHWTPPPSCDIGAASPWLTF